MSPDWLPRASPRASPQTHAGWFRREAGDLRIRCGSSCLRSQLDTSAENVGGRERALAKGGGLVEPSAALACRARDQSLLFHSPERHVNAAALERAARRRHELEAVAGPFADQKLQDDALGAGKLHWQ